MKTILGLSKYLIEGSSIYIEALEHDMWLVKIYASNGEKLGEIIAGPSLEDAISDLIDKIAELW